MIKNLKKAEQMLEDAQKKARERKIDIPNIEYVLKIVEKRLDIPKKYMIGIKVSADYNAQSFPRAYKGRPESTHFSAEYRSSGWCIVNIWRGYCNDNRGSIELSDIAKEKIINKISKL